VHLDASASTSTDPDSLRDRDEGLMPRGGTAPGERRGGRRPGTPNKRTIGKAYEAHKRNLRAQSVDCTLLDVTATLIAMVPDPDDRRLVSESIDRYVNARERASKKQKYGRSVTKGAPIPRNPP